MAAAGGAGGAAGGAGGAADASRQKREERKKRRIFAIDILNGNNKIDTRITRTWIGANRARVIFGNDYVIAPYFLVGPPSVSVGRIDAARGGIIDWIVYALGFDPYGYPILGE